MASIKVIHISQFKAQYLVPSTPKRNQQGGLRIDFDYKDPKLENAHYLLQCPKMRLPFGLQAFEKQKGESKGEISGQSYSLSLSIDNYKDMNSHDTEFMRGIKEIDEYVKTLAVENANTWFRKTMKKDVIDELYTPSIKSSQEWAPIFRAKLPYYNGKFGCDFYDTAQSKCDSNIISQNSHCITLVNLSSLWFVNNRFGSQWVIKQVQIFPPPKYDRFMITTERTDDDENPFHSERDRSRSPRDNFSITDEKSNNSDEKLDD